MTYSGRPPRRAIAAVLLVGAALGSGCAHAPATEPPPVTRRATPAEARAIGLVIKERYREVTRCYWQEHAARTEASPALAGTLGVRFVVTPDGRVASAAVAMDRTTLPSPSMAECVRAAIAAMAFPPAPGPPIEARWTSSFAPEP